MPLVTTKDMFEKSMKEKFAIGAFNVNNMEIIQAIVDAAASQSNITGIFKCNKICKNWIFKKNGRGSIR